MKCVFYTKPVKVMLNLTCFETERDGVCYSVQAGQNENVIVRVVWNGDSRLHNASNVRVTIVSGFVLITTKSYSILSI